jgi:phosphatidylserine/phosphatidylglycerophosphate/cardiolipin synthase-like enzyme
LTRGQTIVLLVGLILLGLTQASCARVQSHYELPRLAVADPSFLPTLEAYTSTALGGNTVDLLLNGDQIFPAALQAIRSARATINDEVNVVVDHSDVVGQLEKIFVDDLTYSRTVGLERWRSRGFVDRLLEMLSLPVRGEL